MTAVLYISCSKESATVQDPNLSTKGTIEVTARLIEIPEPFPDLPMYDYAYILKYEVEKVHRGKLETDTIYVGHYNPLKPRSEVADVRVKEIGGDLERFEAGAVHRMALEVPIDDYYLGGIINKYFEEKPRPIYWPVWTNRVTR